MTTVKLRALRVFRFGGEWVQPGDAIECDEQTASDLLKWGWAEPADNAMVGLIYTSPGTERSPNWVTQQ